MKEEVSQQHYACYCTCTQRNAIISSRLLHRYYHVVHVLSQSFDFWSWFFFLYFYELLFDRDRDFSGFEIAWAISTTSCREVPQIDSKFKSLMTFDGKIFLQWHKAIVLLSCLSNNPLRASWQNGAQAGSHSLTPNHQGHQQTIYRERNSLGLVKQLINQVKILWAVLKGLGEFRSRLFIVLFKYSRVTFIIILFNIMAEGSKKPHEGRKK